MPLKDREARRAYNKAYQKKHYRDNKEYYVNKAKAHNRNQRKWGREFVKRVKAMRRCFDCGESNPIILEFDHVRGEKVMNIADMVNNSYSLNTIKDEIRKCEVRCANCHRKKTHERRNS
jgi:hypothetical protein